MAPADFSSKKGLLLALEGIDGAGTTTQMERLKNALTGRGYEVHLTREPSDNIIGQIIRKALTASLKDTNNQIVTLNDPTVALLFAADRLHHISSEIEPALKEGKIVITDRYYGSSLVYQGALCGVDWVKEINSRAIKPDLTLYFSLPVAIANSRRKKRGMPKERFEEEALLAEVASRYERLYAADAQAVVIDAAGSIEEITAACLKAISRLLG